MKDEIILKVIFFRAGKYLNERYQWSVVPWLFPGWQAQRLPRLFERWKDTPTHFAMVSDAGVIDLDGLELIEL